MTTQAPPPDPKFSDVADGLIGLSDKLVQLAKDIPGVGTTRLNDLARRAQVMAKEAHDLGAVFYQILRLQSESKNRAEPSPAKAVVETAKAVESTPSVQPLDTSIGKEKAKKT